MLTCCWSVKGGSGVTVVAAGLALRSARYEPSVLVDLCGDLPAALGLPEPEGPGIADWLRKGATIRGAVPAVDAGPGLRLVPRGQGPLRSGGLGALSACGSVVVDAGVVTEANVTNDAAVAAAISTADRSLLVLRPCYLALRRAVRVGLRPDGIVLVTEPGRALGAGDIAAVLGAPVVAEVPVDPAISRAVDAGLLVQRCPSTLVRSLEGAPR